MDQFAQQVQAWQPFYSTVASASATLVGLLFVSLSVKPMLLKQQQNVQMLRRARQAFLAFVYILAIALMFLIPNQTPYGLGLPIICMAAGGLLRLSYAFIHEMRSSQAPVNFPYLFSDFGFQFFAYSGMIVISISILMGNAHLLDWLVGVVVFLLLSAAKNAWSLLFQVEDLPA